MTTSLLFTLSAVAVGLMSGLYWAFTVVVMPSLRANDDRSFIAFMQAGNRVTISIWFLPVFVGSLLLPIAAAIALIAGDNDDAKRWGVASAVLAALPVAITAGGNVPLNLALDRAGDVETASMTRLRCGEHLKDPGRTSTSGEPSLPPRRSSR